MKAILPLLTLAILGATAPSRAADPAPVPAAPAPAQGEFASRLQDITAQLGLTEEQKAKIAPILQQEAADLRALKADASLRRLQRLRQFREINQKASDQIRALLTPEQQPRYDELRAAARAEMKQKMKERHAAGGN
jgi:Spy/CpxP family protein refolding chaperone